MLSTLAKSHNLPSFKPLCRLPRPHSNIHPKETVFFRFRSEGFPSDKRKKADAFIFFASDSRKFSLTQKQECRHREVLTEAIFH